MNQQELQTVARAQAPRTRQDWSYYSRAVALEPQMNVREYKQGALFRFEGDLAQQSQQSVDVIEAMAIGLRRKFVARPEEASMSITRRRLYFVPQDDLDAYNPHNPRRVRLSYSLDIEAFNNRWQFFSFETMMRNAIGYIVQRHAIDGAVSYVNIRWVNDLGYGDTSREHTMQFIYDEDGTIPGSFPTIAALARGIYEFLFHGGALSTYTGYELLDRIGIDIIHYQPPVAAGYLAMCSSAQRAKQSRSIVSIKSTTECAFYAVTLGIMYTRRRTSSNLHRQYKVARTNQEKSVDLREMVRKLSTKSGVPLQPISLVRDLPRLQAALLSPEYEEIYGKIQLNLVDETRNGVIQPMSDYPGDDYRCVYLRYSESKECSCGHIDLIVNMAGYMRSAFCHQCKAVYDRRSPHSNCVVKACQRCHHDHKLISAPQGQVVNQLVCAACKKHFYFEECLLAHRLYYCKHVQCANCGAYYSTGRNAPEHICGYWFCKVCKTRCQLGSRHECCWKPIRSVQLDKPAKWVFFDFETYRKSSFQIEVQLGYMRWDETMRAKFHSVAEFMQIVSAPEFENAVFIAHHGSGFDFRLIVNWMITNGIYPGVTRRGHKLLKVKYGNRSFIDSWRHLDGSLDSIAEEFGLDKELGLRKQFFPYDLFSSDGESVEIKSGLPEAKWYRPDRMANDTRNRFYKWYERESKSIQRAGPFDALKELGIQCCNDVDVGYEVWKRYSQATWDDTGLLPHNFITAAQLCKRIYQEFFLEQNTIAMVRANEYALASQDEIDWLRYLSFLTNSPIVHAKTENRREFLFVDSSDHGIPVSGHYGSTIFFFWNCYHNGCIECYPLDRTKQGTDGKSFEEKYLATKHIESVALNQGLRLSTSPSIIVTTWSCKFNRVKDMVDVNSPERLQIMLSNLSSPVVTTVVNQASFREWYANANDHAENKIVSLKDAVMGGLTHVGFLYRNVPENAHIELLDVNGQYCAITAGNHEFPVGRAKIEYNMDVDDFLQQISTTRRGHAYVKIVPYRKLRRGVLGVRFGLKTLYPVCRRCMEMNEGKIVPIVPIAEFKACGHSSEEAALTGYWGTPEIQYAIQLGYEIQKVYEVHYYEKWSRTLFSGYMGVFYPNKLYNNGYKDEKDVDEIVEQHRQKYPHMPLDKSKFKKQRNAVLRKVNKDRANKFIGKFNQDRAQKKHHFIHDFMEHDQLIRRYRNAYDFTLKESYSACDLFELTKKIEVGDEANMTTSEPHFAYVTMYGRLQIMHAMNWHETANDGSGDRVIYGDTDSMAIYVGPNDEIYPTDKTLGGFERQAVIDKMFVLGKKSYGYREKDKTETFYDEELKTFRERPKITIRAKGFTQSYKVNQNLTLDRLREIATSSTEAEDVATIEQLDFYEQGTDMYMRLTKKKLGRCFNGGHLVEYPNGDIAAVPFGWDPA